MPQVKLYIAVAFISVKYSHLSEEGNMLPRLDWILDTTEEVRELDGRNDGIRENFNTFTELLKNWSTYEPPFFLTSLNILLYQVNTIHCPFNRNWFY